MTEGILTRMTPAEFNYYAEKSAIPWRWKEDVKNEKWLEADEVACLKEDCAIGTPYFWAEAGEVLKTAIPAMVLQIVTDRFLDGEPLNNTPVKACAERPNPGTEQHLCEKLMKEMYDPTREHPGKYHGGDPQGILQAIPYLKRLGAEVIWIAPMGENQVGFAPGAGPYAEKNGITGYHGYWPSNLTRIDPHFSSACWGNGGPSPGFKSCREEDRHFYHSFMLAMHAAGFSVQVDLITDHVGPRTRTHRSVNENGVLMGTLDAGKIYIGDALVADYWEEHVFQLDLARQAFDPDPFAPSSIIKVFHHTPNIDHWTFTPADYCGYWKRMETGHLADLADLNIYGSEAARFMILENANTHTPYAAGIRFDTLIYGVLACNHEYGKNSEGGEIKNIVLEITRRMRESKEGYSPITGEWFDLFHLKDVFDAGAHFFLHPDIPPPEQLDLFDFGFKYAVHSVFSERFHTLGDFHNYLDEYMDYPLDIQVRRAPFVDNHDMPVLLNESGWPTYEDLHQATLLSFMFPGIPYVYAQNLKYKHDTGWNLGLFGWGGDPFNRIMVDPPTDADPLLTTPMERLVSRLAAFRREYNKALSLGDFKSGLLNEREDFGNENVLAIKREFVGEEILYLHVRRTEESPDLNLDETLQTIKVDFKPGIYTDPITTIQYEVREDQTILPLTADYYDPIWERQIRIDENGEYHIADQFWVNGGSGNGFNIENDTALQADPYGSDLFPHSPDPDHIADIKFKVVNGKIVRADGRYRIQQEELITTSTGHVLSQPVEEIVDIYDGRIRMIPDYRTIILARHNDELERQLRANNLPTDYAGVGLNVVPD